MTHADTLREMAKTFMIVGNYERADALIAGAEALEAIGRVRHALSGIAREKADSEYAAAYLSAEWYVATADALEYVIDLLTEALKGETE